MEFYTFLFQYLDRDLEQHCDHMHTYETNFSRAEMKTLIVRLNLWEISDLQLKNKTTKEQDKGIWQLMITNIWPKCHPRTHAKEQLWRNSECVACLCRCPKKMWLKKHLSKNPFEVFECCYCSFKCLLLLNQTHSPNRLFTLSSQVVAKLSSLQVHSDIWKLNIHT